MADPNSIQTRDRHRLKILPAAESGSIHQGFRSFMGWDSCVTYSPGLLADYWDAREYLCNPGHPEYALYQDVYRGPPPAETETAVPPAAAEILRQTSPRR